MNTQSELSLNCNCSNCEQEGFTSVSYQWELHVKNEVTEEWDAVSSLSQKTLTSIYQKNLVLSKGTLYEGRNYRLICRIKNEGELGKLC